MSDKFTTVGIIILSYLYLVGPQQQPKVELKAREPDTAQAASPPVNPGPFRVEDDAVDDTAIAPPAEATAAPLTKPPELRHLVPVPPVYRAPVRQTPRSCSGPNCQPMPRRGFLGGRWKRF